jgi:hypothetical protein
MVQHLFTPENPDCLPVTASLDQGNLPAQMVFG